MFRENKPESNKNVYSVTETLEAQSYTSYIPPRRAHTPVNPATLIQIGLLDENELV